MALYELAGLLVEMSPQYPTLSKQAEQYLSSRVNAEPDIKILPDQSYIDSMLKAAPQFTPDSAEYCHVGSLFYRALLRYGGMMLHASAVVLDGRAYLFTAPSGTGKSTHTAGWIRHFGQRAFILNDDKPAMRFRGGELIAYGTPFSGKTDLSRNCAVPVAGICMLGRDSENSICRASANEAIPFLYGQTIRRVSRDEGVMLLETLTRVVQTVPLWRMNCTVGDESVVMAYEAMAGGVKP